MKLFEWITGNRQQKENPPQYSLWDPLWGNEKQMVSPERDELASRLTLYGHSTCVYCREVSDVIDQLGISIKIRNTFKYPEYKQDLVIGGGKTTIPCLRIAFQYGNELWLYDSASIIDFLEQSFPHKNNEEMPLESEY